MRIAGWVVLTMLMSGCIDKAEEAKKRLAMVEKVGTLGEVCLAARAVAEAYLEQGDEKNYRFEHAVSVSKCLTAQLDGWNRPAQADLREQASAAADAMEAAAMGPPAGAAVEPQRLDVDTVEEDVELGSDEADPVTDEAATVDE